MDLTNNHSESNSKSTHRSNNNQFGLQIKRAQLKVLNFNRLQKQFKTKLNCLSQSPKIYLPKTNQLSRRFKSKYLLLLDSQRIRSKQRIVHDIHQKRDLKLHLIIRILHLEQIHDLLH